MAGSGITIGALGSAFPTILNSRYAADNLDKFDYVVVLMLENRSFDNVLGYLYTPENPPPYGQSYEGVAWKNLSQPIPPYADSSFMGSIPVHKDSVLNNPNPDPGEEYPHINTDLFGTVIPDTNRFLNSEDMFPPYNLPDSLPAQYPMNGFVMDYINKFRSSQGRMPTYSEYKIIMSCFPPEWVPVISTLAKGFAVCDHWHCSVPSQTFCNRSFFNCAASGGFVNNEPYPKWIQNTQETIFERLQNRGQTWKIYFDYKDVLPMSLLIHYSRLKQYARTNICSFDQFLYECVAGKLPRYSFIEPRLIFFHNDEHPPAPLFGNVTFPSSVTPGERLIHTVYEAIKLSNSSSGNNWRNTLFIITYDEAGGCFDHVQPPSATPPYANQPNTEMDFKFDRLGVRVSTVMVSPYIREGTIISENLTHTSVIKTMSEKWNLGNLTNRDLNSPSLKNIFNLETPREPDTWPVTKPRQETVQGDKEYYLNREMNELQRGFVGLANAIATGREELPDGVNSVKDGLDFLLEVVKILKVSFSCNQF